MPVSYSSYINASNTLKKEQIDFKTKYLVVRYVLQNSGSARHAHKVDKLTKFLQDISIYPSL